MDDLDRDFIADLYEHYALFMRKVASHFTADSFLVEDFVQESYLRLLLKPRLIRAVTPKAMPVYLAKVVRSVAVDYMRSARVRNTVLFADVPEGRPVTLELESTLVDQILQQLEIANLLTAIADLAKIDQFILQGKYVLGLSDAQLSNYLNIGRDSVRVYARRARLRAAKNYLAKFG